VKYKSFTQRFAPGEKSPDFEEGMVIIMEQLTSILAIILLLIGLLAMMVSIIIEVTKGIPLLNKISKDVKVVVLSLALSLFLYFAYISYSGTAIIWYYTIGTVLTSFVVAFIVMYGWGKFSSLYKKFRNIPTLDTAVNMTTDIHANSSDDNLEVDSTTDNNNSNTTDNNTQL
jgi:hypothetical protein